MFKEGPPDRQKPEESVGAPEKLCPWCHGVLSFHPRFPLAGMIPGGVRASGADKVPEALRTIRAWVCTNPHCKYRESA